LWREAMTNNKTVLWYRWTGANALAELLGLGATFATIGLLVSRIDTQKITGILLAFLLTVASGAIEATLVGLAQWWAMQPAFPMIRRVAWWRATLIGALLGYALGYLPSTLMSMGEAIAQTSQAEPPQWVTLLLAAGLGAAAGAVLSFAQWLVLRGKVRRAGLWIPANMLAWACGMPVIFWGMDIAFKQSGLWQSVLVIGAAILVAGLVVGAIHGRFLVVMAGG
jgi:hypothetical protein